MKNTDILKKHLLETYQIKSDRDLIQQLGIKKEDKAKLFAWIEYQCAYHYNEGHADGEQQLKIKLYSLIKPKDSEWI